ncbi:hypothetical protein D3C80_1880430 [compost metagenome]
MTGETVAQPASTVAQLSNISFERLLAIINPLLVSNIRIRQGSRELSLKRLGGLIKQLLGFTVRFVPP